jgi:endoglucanase
MLRRLTSLIVLACSGSLPVSGVQSAVLYTGVNLAGAEFGESNLPGVYNTHYTYPRSNEVDYFLGKGMNTFRLPFRWERLQPAQNGQFNAAELTRMKTFVNYATSHGAYVVLDPHNYARYYGAVVGTAGLPNSSLADFWTRLSNEFKTNDRIIFGLMNEPHTMPTEQWRDAANATIAAIRDTGATNLILVPGNAWTGAHSWSQNWYGTPNAVAMLSITDPGNNFAFDAHQYLDSNSSGSSSQIVSPTIGRERLVDFTNWLRTNNRRGFLGEFAVANSQIGNAGTQIGDEAIDQMLGYIASNDDVWLGWTWWSAGPWWGNYMFSLEPTNLGQPTQADRPALAVLQQHLVSASPMLHGDYNQDGMVDAADYVVWRKTLGQSGTNLPADGNSDNMVDDLDYELWRSNFGQAETLGITSLSVPEPASWMLLLTAVAALLQLHRLSQGDKTGSGIAMRITPAPRPHIR